MMGLFFKETEHDFVIKCVVTILNGKKVIERKCMKGKLTVETLWRKNENSRNEGHQLWLEQIDNLPQ